MYTLFIIVHVICSVLLVAIVLLQVGRGRGMMGFLGSSTAETLFGSRAGDVLTHSTTIIAAMFMITSLSLTYMTIKKTGSVTKGIKQRPGAIQDLAKMPAGVPGAEDKIAEKGADIVGRAKDKLLKKIPYFGARKKTAAGDTEKGKALPKETVKSNIRYDENRNKIVDETKFDSTGKLTGHREVTYDRFDKQISEKELPLTEESASVETK